MHLPSGVCVLGCVGCSRLHCSGVTTESLLKWLFIMLKMLAYRFKFGRSFYPNQLRLCSRYFI